MKVTSEIISNKITYLARGDDFSYICEKGSDMVQIVNCLGCSVVYAPYEINDLDSFSDYADFLNNEGWCS